MSNRKKSKFSALFWTKTDRKKIWQKLSQQAAPMQGVPLISAKTLHFQAYCEDRSKKIQPTPSKKSENCNVFRYYPAEIFWRPKLWNMIDPDPVVVFIQKSDESDRKVPRKLDLKK